MYQKESASTVYYKKWNESNYIFLNLYQLHLNSCGFLSNKNLFFINFSDLVYDRDRSRSNDRS